MTPAKFSGCLTLLASFKYTQLPLLWSEIGKPPMLTLFMNAPEEHVANHSVGLRAVSSTDRDRRPRPVTSFPRAVSGQASERGRRAQSKRAILSSCAKRRMTFISLHREENGAAVGRSVGGSVSLRVRAVFAASARASLVVAPSSRRRRG